MPGERLIKSVIIAIFKANYEHIMWAILWKLIIWTLNIVVTLVTTVIKETFQIIKSKSYLTKLSILSYIHFFLLTSFLQKQ